MVDRPRDSLRSAAGVCDATRRPSTISRTSPNRPPGNGRAVLSARFEAHRPSRVARGCAGAAVSKTSSAGVYRPVLIRWVAPETRTHGRKCGLSAGTLAQAARAAAPAACSSVRRSDGSFRPPSSSLSTQKEVHFAVDWSSGSDSRESRSGCQRVIACGKGRAGLRGSARGILWRIQRAAPLQRGCFPFASQDLPPRFRPVGFVIFTDTPGTRGPDFAKGHGWRYFCAPADRTPEFTFLVPPIRSLLAPLTRPNGIIAETCGAGKWPFRSRTTRRPRARRM